MKHKALLYSCLTAAIAVTVAGAAAEDRDSDARRAYTATPIKHLVVIFQENVSFDHYFATYPIALNKPGETPQGAEAYAEEHQHAAYAARCEQWVRTARGRRPHQPQSEFQSERARCAE